MSQKIQSLRARIDELNLSLLELLSKRASVAAEIGAEHAVDPSGAHGDRRALGKGAAD